MNNPRNKELYGLWKNSEELFLTQKLQHCSNRSDIEQSVSKDDLMEFVLNVRGSKRMNNDRYRCVRLPFDGGEDRHDEWCEIDEEIADLILELNEKGYRTDACCAGHIEEGYSTDPMSFVNLYISFDRRYMPKGRSHILVTKWRQFENEAAARKDIREFEFECHKEDIVYRVWYRKNARAEELGWIISEFRKVLGLDMLGNDEEVEENTGKDTLIHKGQKLAYLLRHDKSYRFSPSGWRSVGDLVANHGYTKEELEKIVSTDEKGRYEFNGDHTMVRACQGHSINVSVPMKKGVPPDILYHGTATRFIKSIRATGGLKKMKRLYVHFSTDRDMAERVGFRHGTPVVLEIDAKQMYEDGMEFLQSHNNVWLSDDVPAKYIRNLYEVSDED